MKKIYVFLCVAFVLLLGSCTDLLMDDEKAVQADLPADFDWQKYAEINKDVAASQIILKLGKEREADSIENCVRLLSDLNFAKEVYSDYLQCPSTSWYKYEKCSGKYAINSKYSSVFKAESGKDTIWQCVIENCWNGGWDKISDKDEECVADIHAHEGCLLEKSNYTYITKDVIGDSIVEPTQCNKDGIVCDTIYTYTLKPLASILQDSLNKYLENSKTNLGAINAMCQFVPKASTSEEAKNILKNFNYDPYLIEQHYHFFGRNDGRPYKYCNGNGGEEKTQNLPLVVKRASINNYYYDYGKYTFCLEETDQTIRVVK